MNIYWILFIVLVFGILSALILNVLYKHTNAYNNQFIDIRKFKGMSADAQFDVVNLGSNQPKFAFDYSECKINGMNWAIGPQAFEYDFAILKKYASHLHKGSVVIIPVCPLKFFLLRNSSSSLIKYYQLLEKEGMPNYSGFQKIREIYFPLLSNPRRMIYLLRDIKFDNRLTLTNNPMSAEQVEEDANSWIDNCWNPEFGINIVNMQSLSQQNEESIKGNIKILSNIITYCLDNGFEPVISLLPVTDSLRAKFDESFIHKYIVDCINHSVDDRSVKVINYLDNNEFSNNEYYINSFFMNRTGARMFSKHFIGKLLNQ